MYLSIIAFSHASHHQMPTKTKKRLKHAIMKRIVDIVSINETSQHFQMEPA